MNEEILVSIITPTYNRANLLPNLYESLCKQTDFSFEWVVVDDGSTDNTKEVVSEFRPENFKINYLIKPNGGKHTALNYGIKHCNGILTFIVDSDDTLTLDSIETIKKYYYKYKENNTLCGFSFLRQYPDGELNITSGHEDEYIGSYNQVRVYEQRIGDMAEVYYTDILKRYPFPEFEKEKFLGEDIVWMEIGGGYNLVFINKPIYIGNYLVGGLTKNRKIYNIKSCRGCYELSKKTLEIKIPFKFKIKKLIQLYVYGKFAGIKYKQMKLDCNNNKIWLCIVRFPSYLLYKYWNRKYNK